MVSCEKKKKKKKTKRERDYDFALTKGNTFSQFDIEHRIIFTVYKIIYQLVDGENNIFVA